MSNTRIYSILWHSPKYTFTEELMLSVVSDGSNQRFEKCLACGGLHRRIVRKYHNWTYFMVRLSFLAIPLEKYSYLYK